MTTQDHTEAGVVADLAMRAIEPHLLLDGVASIVVPEGGRHIEIDLERFDPHPRRKHGVVHLHTPSSLTRYVCAHAGVATMLYADATRAAVVAVLNDHQAVVDGNEPGWGDHIAGLTLRHTPEWVAWAGASGMWKEQDEFAEFVEDHIDDVVSPAGAELLELARTFEATKGAEFRSAIRLDSGQRQLTCAETITARAGQTGQIVIPERFTLGLAPFEGVDPYRIEARLRYRINDGSLLLGFVLDRTERLLRAVFDDIVQRIEVETGRPVINGVYSGSRPSA